MKPGGGKIKGHSFENRIVKVLSNWWGEKRSFCRTPLSGGWSKLSGTNETSQYVVGDLVCPKEFPFTIEVKKDESFEFHHLLESPVNCALAQWLRKLEEEDCAISGKKPMLIFPRNFWSLYVVVRKRDFDKLCIGTITFRWKDWVIFKLEDFTSGVLKENLIAGFGGEK